jgi:hypothetical protein
LEANPRKERPCPKVSCIYVGARIQQHAHTLKQFAYIFVGAHIHPHANTLKRFAFKRKAKRRPTIFVNHIDVCARTNQITRKIPQIFVASKKKRRFIVVANSIYV